jgi:glycine betaine/proline transport system substrate-binding protein
MRVLKLTVAAAAVTLAIASPRPGLAETKCGTGDEITIANMTWLSANVLAQVTHRILTAGYGCKAKLVPGDTVPTATSMLTKNRPHIAPEMWISTASSIWDAINKKGNVYKASDVFGSGGKEGWSIPDYVAKANPGLKTVSDLKNPKYAALFAEAQSGGKGRLYGCPPGWGCEIITNNLYKALELKKANYQLFSPGSGANLKASIARRVTRKQPVLAYYWGPTAVIGRYKLVRLGMPAYEAKKFTCLTDKYCANPQVTGWKPGEVGVAVVADLKKKAPNVTAFLAKLQVPNEVVNQELAWGDGRKASAEEVAMHFFKNHEAVWSKWVPADVAARVKASLK